MNALLMLLWIIFLGHGLAQSLMLWGSAIICFVAFIVDLLYLIVAHNVVPDRFNFSLTMRLKYCSDWSGNTTNFGCACTPLAKWQFKCIPFARSGVCIYAATWAELSHFLGKCRNFIPSSEAEIIHSADTKPGCIFLSAKLIAELKSWLKFSTYRCLIGSSRYIC